MDCVKLQKENPTALREQKFRFEDDLCYIELSDGSEVFIDASDYDLVKDRRWHSCSGGGDDTGKWTYARTTCNNKNVRLHRLLMDAQPGDICDHIDRNTRNNCRSNLRFVSCSENVWNSSKQSNSATSIHKGVYWNKKSNKWVASITINYKQKEIGNRSC
jgi:hypothetical protein